MVPVLSGKGIMVHPDLSMGNPHHLSMGSLHHLSMDNLQHRSMDNLQHLSMEHQDQVFPVSPHPSLVIQHLHPLLHLCLHMDHLHQFMEPQIQLLASHPQA